MRTGGELDGLPLPGDIDLDDIVRTHEGGDEGRGRPVVDLLRRADLDDVASRHDGDPVRHHHGLLAIVGDMDRSNADLLLDRLDLMAHGRPDARIEVGERLIEQQNARIDRERPAERHPLALTAGELCHRPLGQALEAEQSHDLLHPGSPLRARHAPQTEAIGQVLRHRHVRPQCIGLEHHGHVAPFRRQLRDIALGHPDRSGLDRNEAGDGA